MIFFSSHLSFICQYGIHLILFYTLVLDKSMVNRSLLISFGFALEDSHACSMHF